MALNNFSAGARNAMVDALVDLLDVGAGANGTIEIATAAFASVLAILDFTAKATNAFGAASGGVATANTIADETSAPATGTAAVFRVKDCDGSVVWEGTVGSGSGDIDLSSTSITTGDTVAITSWTVTAPS